MKMGKKKRNSLIAGILITGLIASNGYTYLEWQNTKKESSERAEDAKEAQHLKKELNMVVSKINQSEEYASHEDMIYAFNMYSASNRIQYEGKDYYADIKDIFSHSFDKKEKTKYTAQAEMTFLADKIYNNTSYIQNELPRRLLENYLDMTNKGETHEHEGHAHEGDSHEEGVSEIGIPEEVIPVEKMVKLEKEAKEKFVIHQWKQELSFNMKGHAIVEPTPEMEDEIVEEFVKMVVLNERGIDGEKAVIGSQKNRQKQTVTVKTEEKTIVFTYDKETKELREID